jgi:Cu(I)/Ag(I) efflux system periplasmic protein CusF
MRTIHLFLLGLVLSTAAWAQGADSSLTEAEVRKVDRDAGKITLKHGEIKNLDMPPMTMVFRVKDAAMLDKARVGDKVRFAAQKIDGTYVITEIIPGP